MIMVVYDVKTGESLTCESVDARELIASGQYTAERKEEEKPKRGRPAKGEEE
jgi:hypothetical protein